MEIETLKWSAVVKKRRKWLALTEKSVAFNREADIRGWEDGDSLYANVACAITGKKIL